MALGNDTVRLIVSMARGLFTGQTNRGHKVRVFETPNLHLKKVIFEDRAPGSPIGSGVQTTLIEQNPAKASKWAQLAREGSQVAQVIRDGKFVGAVVDNKFVEYGTQQAQKKG